MLLIRRKFDNAKLFVKLEVVELVQQKYNSTYKCNLCKTEKNI